MKPMQTDLLTYWEGCQNNLDSKYSYKEECKSSILNFMKEMLEKNNINEVFIVENNEKLQLLGWSELRFGKALILFAQKQWHSAVYQSLLSISNDPHHLLSKEAYSFIQAMPIPKGINTALVLSANNTDSQLVQKIQGYYKNRCNGESDE